MTIAKATTANISTTTKTSLLTATTTTINDTTTNITAAAAATVHYSYFKILLNYVYTNILVTTTTNLYCRVDTYRMRLSCWRGVTTNYYNYSPTTTTTTTPTTTSADTTCHASCSLTIYAGVH